jgi:hypothetical protein
MWFPHLARGQHRPGPVRNRPHGNLPGPTVRRSSCQIACPSTRRNDCRSSSDNNHRSGLGNCCRSSSYRPRCFCGLDRRCWSRLLLQCRSSRNCWNLRGGRTSFHLSWLPRWFCGLDRRCESRLLLQCRSSRNCWNLRDGRMSLRLGWLPRWSHNRGQSCCNRHWCRSLRSCHECYRRSVLFLALHKNREYTGRVLDHSRSAAIRRAQAIAANQLHAEAFSARLGLAERLFVDPDLQPGKICKLLGQMRECSTIAK